MHSERNIDRDRPTPAETRTIWARGLSNRDIADFLQGKLLESRAVRMHMVSLLAELVHEIKHRLSVTEYGHNEQSGYDDWSAWEKESRISWARSQSNDDICIVLQGKLLDAGAERANITSLFNELVHEIKHRLLVTKYDHRRYEEYDDEPCGEED